MQIIIDGYNLIRRAPCLAALDRQDLEAGREGLLQGLVAYQGRKKHRITVVFDGRERGYPIEHREKRGGLLVVFSQRGEEADRVILRLTTPGTVIITSDRELAGAVERAGAIALEVEAFWAKVEAAAYREAKGIEEEDEERFRPAKKKGPSHKPSKAVRRKEEVLRRL